MDQEQLTIAFVSEGACDRAVLMPIITTITGNDNIVFTPLPPATGGYEGWSGVLKYCALEEFKGFFQTGESYAVIHIDTDFQTEYNCGAKYQISGVEQMDTTQLLAAMRGLLIAQIGDEFYDAVAHRIIFAIAERQTECWLLSIYHPGDNVLAGKVKGCVSEMKKIAEREGFRLKKFSDYETICGEHFKTKEDLLRHSRPNESFAAFIHELSEKLPAEAAE